MKKTVNLGTTQATDLANFAKGILQIADIADDALHDKKINLLDINLIPSLAKGFQLVNSGIKSISFFRALTPDAIDVVKAEIAKEIAELKSDKQGDKLEEIAETVLNGALSFAQILTQLKSF